MVIKRIRYYSCYNGDEAIQKEFGLFGFLTGTGANAYETRRDLGNGYTEVTKNTLGDKISNFFNGTKKVRNQGYVPGVNETSYRDGGIFTKIGNKAEAGFNSMKNTANSVTNSVKNSVNNVKSSIGNTLKSTNAMTPTGSVPRRMTKNPQATQLELFNRDGSPTFNANANKPVTPVTNPSNPAATNTPAANNNANGKRGGNFNNGSKNSRQRRAAQARLNNANSAASQVNTVVNNSRTAGSRLVTNGVKNARNGRGYFGYMRRYLRR